MLFSNCGQWHVTRDSLFMDTIVKQFVPPLAKILQTLCPVKTQINLDVNPVWQKPLLSTQEISWILCSLVWVQQGSDPKLISLGCLHRWFFRWQLIYYLLFDNNNVSNLDTCLTFATTLNSLFIKTVPFNSEVQFTYWPKKLIKQQKSWIIFSKNMLQTKYVTKLWPKRDWRQLTSINVSEAFLN